MNASILQFLKVRGEQLDAEIAAALGMSMTTVRREYRNFAPRGT